MLSKKNKTKQDNQKTVKKVSLVNALPIVPCQLMLNRIIELIIFITFAMKFCRWIVFEHGRALSMELKYVFEEKSIVLRVKPYLNSFRRIWRTYDKQSDIKLSVSLILREVSC